MKSRPEIALTDLQLAELLVEHYPEERAEALEHLDFAINEFRDMKMQPSLERALKHKEILGPWVSTRDNEQPKCVISNHLKVNPY